MLDALKHEIKLRENFFHSEVIHTVYFGGGTPSLLTDTEINELWSVMEQHFSLSQVVEVTLEANPEDLTDEYLLKLKSTPVNRLSIGIQSFDDVDLRMMNRIHQASTAVQSVIRAAQTGFSNITIDLIYGIPGMTGSRWKKNLETALALPVHHLSCYALTVEMKTALAAMIKKKQIPMPEDELSAEHFEILTEVMNEHGWDHYEISNMASSVSYRSMHNSSYWSGQPYLGIGPSAHSFSKTMRSWNIPNNRQYVASLQKGILPCESEQLTEAMQFNEYIMTALRTREGICFSRLVQQFPHKFHLHLYHELPKINPEFLIVDNSSVRLSPKGQLFADKVASDLFFVEK